MPVYKLSNKLKAVLMVSFALIAIIVFLAYPVSSFNDPALADIPPVCAGVNNLANNQLCEAASPLPNLVFLEEATDT